MTNVDNFWLWTKKFLSQLLGFIHGFTVDCKAKISQWEHRKMCVPPCYTDLVLADESRPCNMQQSFFCSKEVAGECANLLLLRLKTQNTRVNSTKTRETSQGRIGGVSLIPVSCICARCVARIHCSQFHIQNESTALSAVLQMISTRIRVTAHRRVVRSSIDPVCRMRNSQTST